VSEGWRVLAVDPRSPCGIHGIIPYFEYIIAINGERLYAQGTNVVKSMINKNRTQLTLRNYKTGLERRLEIFPSQTWGGAGLLGLIIARDDWSTADSRAVRVLSVKPGSQAEQAGFDPLFDYIFGTETFVFSGWCGFIRHIKSHKDSELWLRVYNSSLCELRKVKIKFTDTELFGFELGSGEQHRVPEILPGKLIRSANSLGVEISQGWGAGILATTVMGDSNRILGEPISISDIYLSFGNPIDSLDDEEIKVN